MTPRIPTWLMHAADPEGADLDLALDALVERLGHAHGTAARVAGRAPLGLREVDLGMGIRTFLCAFDGPEFVCLDEDGVPIRDRTLIQRSATMSLVWEQVEAEIDSTRLQELHEAAARLLAIADEPRDMVDAIGQVAEHAAAVRQWRECPLRAIASLTQLDVLFALHEQATAAYSFFVDASEPLVSAQEQMTPDVVTRLGAFEQAAIAAGLGARFSERIAAVIAACDQASNEIVGAYLPVVVLDGSAGTS